MFNYSSYYITLHGHYTFCRCLSLFRIATPEYHCAILFSVVALSCHMTTLFFDLQVLYFPCSACSKQEPTYQAIWADNDAFDEVLVSPTMISDHMPVNVLESMKKVILLSNFGTFYLRGILLMKEERR